MTKTHIPRMYGGGTTEPTGEDPVPTQPTPASGLRVVMSQELLKTVLSSVAKAISTRSINPVLGYVRIVVEPDLLTLTATDGDFTIRRTVAVSGAQPGRALAPARLLNDLVARLSKSELTLEQQGNQLQLRSGRSKYDLTTLGDENFPELPDFTEHRLAMLSCAVLKRALQQTVFASVRESATGGVHYTNGVLFSFKAGRLDICATDGHRLALKRSDGLSGSIERDLLLPSKAADELEKMLPEDDDAICELYHHSNQAFFRFGNLLLASSLLDVKFPDYERVIPKDIDSRVHTGREELSDALGRMLLVCRQKDQNPVARMESGGESLTITTDAGEIGKGSEELAVEIAGCDIRVAVNPGYLIDSLRTLGGDQITLNWISEVNPLMLTSPRDPDFTYIVMPIRLD